jgi:hypothetical protein
MIRELMITDETCENKKGRASMTLPLQKFILWNSAHLDCDHDDTR